NELHLRAIDAVDLLDDAEIEDARMQRCLAQLDFARRLFDQRVRSVGAGFGFFLVFFAAAVRQVLDARLRLGVTAHRRIDQRARQVARGASADTGATDRRGGALLEIRKRIDGASRVLRGPDQEVGAPLILALRMPKAIRERMRRLAKFLANDARIPPGLARTAKLIGQWTLRRGGSQRWLW